MTCCKVISLLAPKSHDIFLSITSILNIIAITSLNDPRLQSVEPEFVENCKFLKPSKNMKGEISTSLVSIAGTIFLTIGKCDRIHQKHKNLAKTDYRSPKAND